MIFRAVGIALVIGLAAGGAFGFWLLHSKLTLARAETEALRDTLSVIAENQHRAEQLINDRAKTTTDILAQLAKSRATIREIIKNEPCANQPLPLGVAEQLRK